MMRPQATGHGPKLSDAELRNVQLGLLDALLTVCRQNDLTCFAAYGTLLGAVRHKGYIPWDDDIDIMMPRRDYERLRGMARVGDAEVRGGHGDTIYPYLNVTICDPRTVGEKEHHFDAGLGAYIDVFPLDHVGKGPKRGLQRLTIALLRNALTAQSLVANPQRSPMKNLAINIIGPISRCISRPMLMRGLERTAQAFSDGPRIGVLTGSYQWCVPRVYLDSGPWLSFEGRRVLAPRGVHEVLSTMYGEEYMSPPPVEQRHSHHGFVPYWRSPSEGGAV